MRRKLPVKPGRAGPLRSDANKIGPGARDRPVVFRLTLPGTASISSSPDLHT
jgi:hypothetical protein